MSTVPEPQWVLIYEGKNITADISDSVISVTYEDSEHGQSDDIEVKIENSDGRWSNGWYPQKGDTIDLQLGYVGESLLPCGTFQIDKIELEGPPDTIVIRALASRITDALREENTRGYENQTLRDVVNAVASKYGMTVQGTIQPIQLRRITQNRERDLGFLKRLAEEYGYVFGMRDNVLTFHDWDTLDSSTPVTVLLKGAVRHYDLEDQTRNVYKAVEVRYHDPVTRQLLQFTYQVEGFEKPPQAEGEAVPVGTEEPGDTLKIIARCEDEDQAEARALAALKRTNGKMTEGRITGEGNVLLIAGNAITLQGFGVLDGDYQIMSSRHSIERDAGYETEIEVRRRVV